MPLAQKPIKVMNLLARMNIGGPAVHVTLVTARFATPDYDSMLVSGTIDPGEGDMLYYAQQHGVQPVIVPELGRSLNPLRDLITLWKLYRLMCAWRPAIVHTNTAKAGFVGRVAARLAGVPVVVHTFHGHIFHGYFAPAKTQFFLWLERFAARLSDTLITLTDSLRDELAHTYHISRREHFTVLPLGLDLSTFARAARKPGTFRAQWHIPLDAPLVGIVARLVPVKNHPLFLEAAATVIKTLPAAHFVIVGDGHLRPEIEAQIDALGLRPRVTITGWTREMANVYADLDVKVISSHNEGTPLTLIEALAAGCPVVATDVGGVAEFLEYGRLGRVTAAGNSEALAEAIIATLRNPPDMPALRQYVIERYSIDRLVRDLDALYKTLLRKKGLPA
ncbi:MAG: glycosyltransferase family 4 protein [Chloroflexi bacterium]|nr:glycosyltransferase family 4 protein [Chloroflexota bacterium]